jgi:hypothetical protein
MYRIGLLHQSFALSPYLQLLDYKDIYCTACKNVLMICVHTKFHMPSSNSSLVMTVKLKPKYIYHTPTMVLYCILQKNYINKGAYNILNNLLPFFISGSYIKWR